MSELHREMVVVESPFSAPTQDEIIRNVYYAMLAVRDSLDRGEAPYASHLFYTQMLDDEIAEERMLGINAGLDIGQFATRTAVYVDLGMSRGMQYGIANAENLGREVEERKIFEDLGQEAITAAIYDEVERHNLPSPATIQGIYARILK